MTHLTWLVAAYIILHTWHYGHGSVPLTEFYDTQHCFNISMIQSPRNLELGTDFDFFGFRYNNVWVTLSGLLVFGNFTWPSPGSTIPAVARLTPYWLSNCWYPCWHWLPTACWKEVTAGQELERVGDEILSYFPELGYFNVSWMLVVTWLDIPNCRNNIQRNTFQAVLVTDGMLTFVIYNYNKIQYTSTAWNNYAQVGFRKDHIHYYAVDGSGTPDIGTIVSRTNVNRTGTFVFRLNGYMLRPVKVADIVFVIDSSYSETESFKNILQYIVNVTDNLKIAPNETQVAVVSFSKTARVDFDFLSCNGKDCVHGRVMNITHLNCTSYMESGLELTSDLFLWTKGGRQSSLKCVVVVSDGLVNNRTNAISKARDLSGRYGGIKVISVGLGKSVFHTLLENVAFNSSYLLAPDPDKLLQLLQWELQDGNLTGCTQDYNADILIIIETSASMNSKTFRKRLNFLHEFLDKLHTDQTNNSITISIAADSKYYVIQGCPLSNLPYIMDSIRTIKHPQGTGHDWDNVLRFVDNHTSYSSVRIRKYAMFITSGLIPEESVAHVKTQLVHLRDNNDVHAVMVGDIKNRNWTVLESAYEYGFFMFSDDDADVVSRVLWSDIRSISCTRVER